MSSKMDPARVRLPSPYSLQALPSSKLSPKGDGPYGQSFNQGAESSTRTPYTTSYGSGYEQEIRKKNLEANYDLEEYRGPNSTVSDIESYGGGASSGNEEVELHEAGEDTTQPPQALQTMVKMVSMLNFMKVELGDHKTLRSKEQWRAAAAEFLGTLMFVYLGCGSVVATGMLTQEMSCGRLVAIALAHGLAICFLAGATGAISGGHLNPAVTLAFVVAGKETLMRAGLYVAAQLLGAIIGAWLLQCSTPQSMQGSLGSHDLGDGVQGGQGFFMEIMLTFVLVFVIFGVAVDRRGPGVIAPIPIGFAVAVDHLVGVPYTGASMNPARSFGPALVSGNWGRAPMIYWFGPCFGAIIASGVYRIGFLEPSLAALQATTERTSSKALNT